MYELLSNLAIQLDSKGSGPLPSPLPTVVMFISESVKRIEGTHGTVTTVWKEIGFGKQRSCPTERVAR